MTSWMEKAKVHFANLPQEQAPKTPERGISEVLGADSNPLHTKTEGVSVVLGGDPCDNTENCVLLDALIQAAMRACDLYGDGQDAREQMRQDCINTPHELRADLLEHFTKEYG